MRSGLQAKRSTNLSPNAGLLRLHLERTSRTTEGGTLEGEWRRGLRTPRSRSKRISSGFSELRLGFWTRVGVLGGLGFRREGEEPERGEHLVAFLRRDAIRREIRRPSQK